MRHYLAITLFASVIVSGCVAIKTQKAQESMEVDPQVVNDQPVKLKTPPADKMSEGGIVGSGKQENCEKNTEGKCVSKAPRLT